MASKKKTKTDKTKAVNPKEKKVATKKVSKNGGGDTPKPPKWP